MQYDSFGNPLRGLQGPVCLPIGFAGGLFDPDTGLTRFVWRDYDADTGRFTALDPLREKGGDSDWYGYCVDDPVNRVDVWGLWSWGDTVSTATTLATKMAENAALIGSRLAGGLTLITAPLGDLISRDNASGVYEETKEYWDKRYPRVEPKDGSTPP